MPNLDENTERMKDQPKKNKIGLWLSIAVFFAIIFYILFFVVLTPSEEKIPALPQIPEIGNKSEVFQEELKSADEAARQPNASADAIGILAQMYHANLYYKEAQDCYLIASSKDPKNPRWSYLLAFIRQKLGNVGNVIPLLEKTIQLQPDYHAALLKLADIHFKRAKIDKAEKEYKEIISNKDAKTYAPYAYLGLGRIAIQKEQWEAAQQYMETSLKEYPQFLGSHRLMADIHKHFGREDQMKLARARAEDYRFAEAPDPWVDDLVDQCFDLSELLRLTDMFFQTFNVEQTQKTIQRLISLYPEEIEVYLRLGNNLNKIFGYAQAKKYFEKALEMEPDNVQALTSYSYTLIQLNMLEEGEKQTLRALELLPENASAKYNLGYIKFYQGKYIEALRLFSEAIKINPSDAKLYFGQGIVAKKMDNPFSAIKYFKKAIEVDPSIDDAHLHIGLLLSQEGKYDEAIQQFKEELVVNPNSSACHFALANEYSAQKNVLDATYHYEEALRINPNFVAAHENFAKILEYHGKIEESLEHFKKIVELEPENPFSHIILAQAYVRSAENEKARESFKEALKLAENKGDKNLVSQLKNILKNLR